MNTTTKDEALQKAVEALNALCEAFMLGGDWRGVAVYDDAVEAIKVGKQAHGIGV